VVVADPWYDYLALPVAPLVLVAQFAALFLRPWWVRWALLAGGTLAILVMLVYVASIELAPDEGANIGAGVLFLWLLVSLVLLVAGGVRELVALVVRSRRARGASSGGPA